jgi:prepilin-type N-terminal cleavage/methylation domain-containing protein
MKTTTRPDGAFTLIELLVVVAVIGILAALLASVVTLAKGKARRVTCLNNLRQISLGVRMYSDDSNDKSPKPAIEVSNPYSAYKELMKSYMGLRGQSSQKDKVFACPADTFYYDYLFGHYPHSAGAVGCVRESICSRPDFDYSSYAFNAGNTFTRNYLIDRPGIAGLPLSSIKHPARTVLAAEAPAFVPFSWHQPKQPLVFENCIFNNAMNMVGFVDGHVNYIRVYTKGGFDFAAVSCNYDPPAGYDYQWSGD